MAFLRLGLPKCAASVFATKIIPSYRERHVEEAFKVTEPTECQAASGDRGSVNTAWCHRTIWQSPVNSQSFGDKCVWQF